MFATVLAPEAPVEAAPEDAPASEKAEFQPMEDRADGYRESAFKVQEWTTANFGKPEALGNDYRVTKKGQWFYLEELKRGEKGTVYGYAGLMIHEDNFLTAARVIAQAAREHAK